MSARDRRIRALARDGLDEVTICCRLTLSLQAVRAVLGSGAEEIAPDGPERLEDAPADGPEEIAPPAAPAPETPEPNRQECQEGAEDAKAMGGACPPPADPEAEAALIAAHIAENGVTRCPAVAVAPMSQPGVFVGHEGVAFDPERIGQRHCWRPLGEGGDRSISSLATRQAASLRFRERRPLGAPDPETT